MTVNPQTMTIRATKLSALVRNARLAAGKSVEECAQLLGIPPEAFTAYELGDNSPSLPELELLAYFLNIPLDYFWDSQARVNEAPAARIDRLRLFGLRQRMIGAQIRKARTERGLTLEALADQAGISPGQLKEFELGAAPIPLTLLETLAAALDRSWQDFRDQHGPLGAWEAQQRAAVAFQQLPPELQLFVSKPVNRPYLELARRLSEMSIEKLRAVAEGLLEITL